MQLTLFNDVVFWRNHFYVLVLHRVAQCLELLERAPVVLQHEKEAFGARHWALATGHALGKHA